MKNLHIASNWVGRNPAYRGPRSALQHVRGGVYDWWWRYSQLSPVFWYARETGRSPANKKVAATYECMGANPGDSFESWWLGGGFSLFTESSQRPAVRLIRTGERRSLDQSGTSILVEVPLNLPVTAIVRDFRTLLSQHHAGKRLKVADYTTAQLTLYTTRARPRALENQYWALVYRLLFPEITAAQIGDRLQVAPHRNIRDDHSLVLRNRYYSKMNRESGPHLHLMAITGRYLAKALGAIENLEHGQFPRFDRLERVHPFGPKYQLDFEESTSCEAGKKSPYQAWLRKLLIRDLKKTVIERNNFRERLSNQDHNLKSRFQAFFEGRSDRLG